MIDFNEKMKNVINNVEGSIACVFSGMDGIGVANVVKEDRFDPSVLDVELSSLIQTFSKVTSNLKITKVDELVLKTADVVFFIKVLGEEYFIGIVLTNDANLGRARLELRKIIPEFKNELYS